MKINIIRDINNYCSSNFPFSDIKISIILLFYVFMKRLFRPNFDRTLTVTSYQGQSVQIWCIMDNPYQ